jgi:hypothetical protein
MLADLSLEDQGHLRSLLERCIASLRGVVARHWGGWINQLGRLRRTNCPTAYAPAAPELLTSSLAPILQHLDQQRHDARIGKPLAHRSQPKLSRTKLREVEAAAVGQYRLNVSTRHGSEFDLRCSEWEIFIDSVRVPARIQSPCSVRGRAIGERLELTRSSSRDARDTTDSRRGSPRNQTTCFELAASDPD